MWDVGCDRMVFAINSDLFLIESDSFRAVSPTHTLKIDLPFRCKTMLVEKRRINRRKGNSTFQMLKIVLEGIDLTDISANVPDNRGRKKLYQIKRKEKGEKRDFLHVIYVFFA